MAAEGAGREDRPDDADDIDARFEEIVSGLRAEQAASAQRHREAIRRSQQERAHRPFEGSEDPNPWPPSGPRTRPERPTPPASRPGDRTNPPWVDPQSTRGEGADQGGERHTDHGGQSPSPATPGATEGSTEPAWRGWEESDEEEHFIPPTPPLPAGDLHLWAIVACLLGGPLLLVLSEIFDVLHGGWWTPVGIVASVAGVVLLILRLPRNRDYTDSSGGAQV